MVRLLLICAVWVELLVATRSTSLRWATRRLLSIRGWSTIVKVEYWIHEIKWKSDEDCEVYGRIIEGSLKVGDVFQYREEPIRDAISQKFTLLRTQRLNVTLIIKKMEFLNHNWDELYAGSTPGLTLSGNQIGSVTNTTILGFEVGN